MTYDEYAPLIKNGDLISVCVAHGIMGKATQFFTRSQYTHSGLAMWLGGELFMAELNGGRNHLIPIIQLTDFDVHACPTELTDVHGAIRKWLSYPVPYGFVAFVAIGLLNWLRIKYYVHWRRILVCSGYCVAIYETAGWQEHSRVISPGELAALLKFKFSVRVKG
jgi:hypothetical protein